MPHLVRAENLPEGTRDVFFKFRTTTEDLAKLHARAEAAGYKTSEFVRRQSLLNPITTADEKLIEVKKEVLRELSSIGSNINQLARVANTTGDVLRPEIEEMNRLFSKLMRRLL